MHSQTHSDTEVCAQTSASPCTHNGQVSAHLHTETLSEITGRNRCDLRMIGIIREGEREREEGGRERREDKELMNEKQQKRGTVENQVNVY